MRRLVLLMLLLCSGLAQADDHQLLYQRAGWPQQQAHFEAALKAAQLRYQDSLPPAMYQALLDSSNRRFAGAAMDERARRTLRSQLDDPQPALQFFSSLLGQRIVQAEIRASAPARIAAQATGPQSPPAEATRRLLIRHLAQALKASEAGAEVSLALASLAADSLGSMLPGLLGDAQTRQLVESQRGRLQQQIENTIDDILLDTYQGLSDPELDEFVGFAQSSAGQAYYQAALAALRSALTPTHNTGGI